MRQELIQKKFPAGRTRRRYILCFALLLLPCITTTCFGQTVIVRIANATNESPVAKQKVSVSGVSGKQATQEEERRKLTGKPTAPDLRLITDGNGRAQFELPKPLPLHFYVRAEMSAAFWDCTCLVWVSTEELLQNGLVVGPHDQEVSNGKLSIQPKPGEILFRLRPTSWWVRLLWPLLVDHPLTVLTGS